MTTPLTKAAALEKVLEGWRGFALAERVAELTRLGIDPADLQIDRFNDAAKSDGYSRRHLYRLIEAGLYPPPVQCGPRKIGFHRIDRLGRLATLEPVTYGPEPEPAAA